MYNVYIYIYVVCIYIYTHTYIHIACPRSKLQTQHLSVGSAAPGPSCPSLRKRESASNMAGYTIFEADD